MKLIEWIIILCFPLLSFAEPSNTWVGKAYFQKNLNNRINCDQEEIYFEATSSNVILYYPSICGFQMGFNANFSVQGRNVLSVNNGPVGTIDGNNLKLAWNNGQADVVVNVSIDGDKLKLFHKATYNYSKNTIEFGGNFSNIH
ncbi:MAG: hypothetical protein QE271_07690 [Bacteriovoracaceae bacterium]|nr:hypothetical protein [Bacteriovoracaceae bacterium]